MKKIIALCIAISTLVNCEEIALIPDISEITPEIIAPSQATIVTATTVNFNWESIEDAEHYRIQIATPSFENASQIVLDSLVTETRFSQDLVNGDYQWRVRGENSGFNTTYTTTAFSIETEDAEPLVETTDLSQTEVTLRTPANNTSLNTNESIAFSWESVPNADTYTIQIVAPNFETITTTVDDQTIETTTFTLNSLEAGSYQWRVKATNTASETETEFTTSAFTVQ